MKIPRSTCGLKWTHIPWSDNFLRASTGTLRFYIQRRAAALDVELTIYRGMKMGWNIPRRRSHRFDTIQQAANAACRIVNRAGSRRTPGQQRVLLGTR